MICDKVSRCTHERVILDTPISVIDRDEQEPKHELLDQVGSPGAYK